MKKKIFSTYLILILVGTLTTGLVSLTLVHNFYEKKIVDNLIIKSDLINQSLLLENEKEENITLHRLSQNYSNKLKVRVTFLDEQGEVLADSYNNSIIFTNRNTRPEVIQAIDGNIGSSKRYSNDINKHMLYVAIPAIRIGRRRLITRVAMPLDEVNGLYKMIAISILFSIIIGVTIAAFMGFNYTNSITEPIKQLTLATSAIAYGDFGRNVNVSTEDEIEELANNFNFMSFKIKDMIEDVEDYNLKIHSILSSMSEGVIAIDKDFNIILMNPLAKNIFNVREIDVIGEHFHKVIKNNSILKIIEETFDSVQGKNREVIVNNSNKSVTLRVLSSLIKEEDSSKATGMVLVIEDITELKKLENMRKEFVSNVSHELKTPLTIINGFVETLIIGNVKEKQTEERFLSIIDSETKRLIKLIDDLLLISKIEHRDKLSACNEDYKRREIVNLNSMINDIYLMFEEMINTKNIRFKTNIEKNLTIQVKDKTLFKQMLINLMDNSIKYNREDGEIDINAYKRYNNVFISIIDSGRGIPKKDIPRIFERFYRVEKGRSRKEGGTGIGLALVKHTAMHLGGNIKVKSELGKWSEFIISLPENYYEG